MLYSLSKFLINTVFCASITCLFHSLFFFMEDSKLITTIKMSRTRELPVLSSMLRVLAQAS